MTHHNPNLQSLTKLLGEVEDPEFEVYSLSVSVLQNEGISLKFPPLNNLKLKKISPTWGDLLQEYCYLYTSGQNFSRSNTHAPILLDSETYELQLIVDQTTINLGTNSFQTWRNRVDPVSRTINQENLIHNHSIYPTIQHQGFIIKIKLINPDLTLRQELENKLYLQESPGLWHESLNNRLINNLSARTPKSRFKLLGVEFQGNVPQTIAQIKQQHFSGLGIKNLVHLQWIVQNFEDHLLSNQQLLSPVNPPVLWQLELLLYFKSALILKIPFSRPRR